MRTVKKALFLLVLSIVTGMNYSSAQVEVVVRARPPMPHYVRVQAPTPRHIWIEEEWEPRGGAYAFVGGHWALPPHPGWIWVPGHWRVRPRGEAWVPGHWRRR
jgi:hypothetical protein